MEKSVYFRAFEPEDAELIYKWMNDDNLRRLSVGVNRHMCREDAEEWVKNRMHDNRNQIFWAVCAVDTNKLIGWASIVDIHYVNRTGTYGGIMIGDSSYNDGFAWIETNLYVLSYAFEVLGLNRLEAHTITAHKTSIFSESLFYFTREGICRQAYFKNGTFYDASLVSILQKEYLQHKYDGDYEMEAVLKRLRLLKKQKHE